ncbi:MAG TPA: methylated-DNA--[protein]-cysteine S-methyltransferase [Acidimicrobiales bacterium]|jgi:O-6-methylguanine DNA methyltransferase|nr:methylated-DNA--[protein]-cysteine S-methyltransferase [Acidimicrobiales bacterium]
MNPAASIVDRLAGLAAAPTVSLVDRVYASFVSVETPLPIGPVLVAYTDRGINYVRPAGDPEQFAAAYRDRFQQPLRMPARAPRSLTEALRTGRTAQLDYDLRGLSAFEQAVLRKALEIPRGETRPYGWIAAEIDRHRAVRAVGTALGHNPIPFLIPCHRVVRSDGTSGEYGFGPELKRQLLAAENVNLDEIHTLAGRGWLFVGSDTTGIVCYPSCRHARRVTPAHLVGFRSVNQALAAGFRPCRHCRPVVAQPA